MKYRLDIDEEINLTIHARLKFSADTLDVHTNEQYQISWPDSQRWVDLLIPSSPDGYHNPLANFIGQRVKGARCLALCAAYNQNGKSGFEIGKSKAFICTQNGDISFFPNDVPGFEWSNWGSIQINVRRIL